MRIGKFLGSIIAPIQGQLCSETKPGTNNLTRILVGKKCGELFRTNVTLTQDTEDITLTLYFLGNCAFEENFNDIRRMLSNKTSAQSNNHHASILNWPLRAHCSNSDELMSYMKHHIDDIFKIKHPPKKVILKAHSLGGVAALHMAKYIKVHYPKVTIEEVITINCFTSISNTIKKGEFFKSSLAVVTIAVAVMALTFLGLGKGLLLTVAFVIISHYFLPSLVYIPAGALIRLCGWDMDNQRLANELRRNFDLTVIHKQAKDDELILGDAQFSGATQIKGDHNNFLEW